MWIRNLDTAECHEVLAGHRYAHLACVQGERPYLVPIYYAYSDKAIYAFSMPGKKIAWMRANPLVALLVEEREGARGWQSVIAEGRYEELPERIGYKRQRDYAWSQLSKHANWWEPGTLKPEAAPAANDLEYVFFRILIEQVSGREAKE
jgi:nitroimidazol reductase NimA-like FMN-containing flavoprotein (pyridoxamine 5'-phosphate oxidase superfamily)